MKAFFPIFFLTILTSALYAQEGYEHLSPVAHGAGRTYVVSATGLGAVGLNPSIIAPEGASNWVISVFPASGYGVDAGPSFSDADSLANVFDLKGGSISTESSNRIANLLLNEKLSGRADAEIIGIEHLFPELGTMAFTWTTHAALRTDIPDEFLTFFINAPSRLLTDPLPGNYSGFDFQGMWYSEYALTFAREVISNGEDLKSLKLGAAIKYVSGTGYLGLDKDNHFNYVAINGGTSIDVNYKVKSAYTSSFDPKNIPTHFSFSFITSDQAGSGYGFDLGAAAEFFPSKTGVAGLTLGTSITDIGMISWSKNATERVANNIKREIRTGGSTIQELNDSLAVLGGVLTHVPSFTTALPTMFRFGALLNMDQSGMTIPYFSSKAAFEFATGLTDVVGSLSHPRLGIGFLLDHSYESAVLRVQIGYSTQQNQSGLTLGVGTTLFEHISVDLSSAHIGELFDAAGRSDFSLAVRGMF